MRTIKTHREYLPVHRNVQTGVFAEKMVTTGTSDDGFHVSYGNYNLNVHEGSILPELEKIIIVGTISRFLIAIFVHVR